MVIGARTAAWSGALSAKSYVQDGLIAMWDGIENAGWGTHDASATTWKDLKGNYDATLSSGNPNWIDNGYVATNNYFRVGSNLGNLQTVTIEVVCNQYVKTTSGNYSSPFSNIEAGGCGFQIVGNDNGNVIFPVGKPSGGYYDYSQSKGPISTNENTHFALSVGIEIRTYRNAMANSFVQSANGIRYNNNFSYLIGKEAGNGSVDGIFNGCVHIVRYYNRALTADEIAANYAVDKARFGLT